LVLAEKDKTTTKDGSDNKPQQAKITNVDTRLGAVTVRIKDSQGREMEKTFTVAPGVRYFDSRGRRVTLDIFTQGNDVSLIEQGGKLLEMKVKNNLDVDPKDRKSSDLTPARK